MTGLVAIADRLARPRLLQARQRDDVASIGFLDVLAVVGVHQQHAADALTAIAGRIDDARAADQRARIDAAERDRADERIVHDLEGQHRHRRFVVGQTLDFLAGLDVDALGRRNIQRARQEVDDRVEQGLDALVLEGRTAQHRIEHARHRRLADQPLERRDIGLLAIEIGTP